MDRQYSSGTGWAWHPGTTTLLAIACALAQASFGYSSTIGPVAPNEVTPTFDLNIPLSYGAAQFGGGFTVTFGVASVVGAILTIFIGDPLGRKKSVGIGAATAFLGSIFQVTGTSSTVFAIGRILSGLGCGFNSAYAPVWQVEAAETRLRGRLILLQLVAKAVGSMVASWVALAYSPQYLYTSDTNTYGYNEPHDRVTWRLPIGMQLVPTGLLLLLIPWLPESPRWLLRKGRIRIATQTVSQLLRRPTDDPSVQHFLLELSGPSEYNYETPFQVSKGMLVTCCCRTRKAEGLPPRQVKRWHRLALGASMQFFAQWSGYAAFQLALASCSSYNERTQEVLQYSSLTWYSVCAALSIALVERLGRRRSLLAAFLGQACCGLIMSGLFSNRQPSTAARHAGIAFSALGQCFCGFNYGLPWLYQLEINAWSMRITGAAVAQVVQYIGSLSLVYGWSWSTNEKRVLFVAPIIFSVLATCVIFCLCPETTGRAPQDLDKYYSTGPSVWVWKQPNAIRVHPQPLDEPTVVGVTEPRELELSTKEVLINTSSSEETIANQSKSMDVVR